MQILSVIDLPQAVPISCFTGATGMQDVLEHMNAAWRSSGSGVIFGEGMFGDRYRAFTELVTNRERAMVAAVERSIQAVTCPDKSFVIESEEDLRHVPPCMYIPILTYAPMRKLFEDGMISGWGVKWEDLPEDDAAGRQLENGRFRTWDPKWQENPDAGVTYNYRSGDPEYTRQQLEDIESSRPFFDTWLEEHLGPGGDHLDPTDLSRQVGKLRPTDEEEEN